MNKSKTIKELHQILVEFEKDNWVAPDDHKSIVRHLAQHIGKLAGKLFTVTEKWEHGFETDETIVKTEVIPDLLYYALSLAKIYDVNLEDSFINRLEMNKMKVEEWRKQKLIPLLKS